MKIGVMFGDPTTTPGGKAIPFHASIRIKLGAGQQIKEGDDVIGIHVSAKTIKNKVAAPFRTANFEIHFGIGIKEHEQIFDLLRKHGPEILNRNEVSLSGTGSWKTLNVTDISTGEILVEKKFRKNEFYQLVESDEYGKYIGDFLEAAMVKKFSSEDPDIDSESYVEIEALSDSLRGD